MGEGNHEGGGTKATSVNRAAHRVRTRALLDINMRQLLSTIHWRQHVIARPEIAGGMPPEEGEREEGTWQFAER